MEINLTENQNKFLQERHYGYIAVISPKTGFPHVTPMWAGMYNNNFYVITSTESAKHRFLKSQENAKIGITIVSSSGHPYLGVVGHAKVIYKEDSSVYNDVVTMLVTKYVNEEERKARINKVLAADDRIVIEILPTRIFGSVK
ncbi:MAG: pyridoxamine 5'-phosphate oxidase family protein [Candidatus Kariarchaeaceae archaeon]|jgi:nitroimidazol reductase NimA-like FMN-containing flavoprotein (pyridoxamine 5'-phosphate oxidase superfamily)